LSAAMTGCWQPRATGFYGIPRGRDRGDHDDGAGGLLVGFRFMRRVEPSRELPRIVAGRLDERIPLTGARMRG